jgi:hypothetical protein
MTHDWHWATRPAGAFFVPTLAPYVLMTEGMRTAREACGTRISVKARACIYKGMLGVIFNVQWPPT